MTSPSQTTRITSRRNPRIVEARKLGQRKHRERQGRFLVEGLQILHLALDAGHVPLEAFYCPDELTGPTARALVERLGPLGADLAEVSAEMLQALSDRDTPQGLVAVFPLLSASLASIPVSRDDLILIVDRLQDPGNLGTLIRTADAAGAAAVVLIEPCVDPHDPKTVRATMGSLFALPVISVADPEELFAWLRDRAVRTLGASPHGGAAWGEGLWGDRVALVLGNEARGLSEDVQPYIDAWVCLPMRGKAESLNVAVAGGILMYAWLRACEPPD